MDLRTLAGGVIWIDAATDVDALLGELDDSWAIARHPVTSGASKESIISAIGASLSFPEWAGTNLDALYDLLTDLEWLTDESGTARNVAVVLDRASSPEAVASEPADWSKIVYVLLDAAAWWQPKERNFLAILR